MKVLSLFDGISCGMVALERAGISVERYTAYEIDKYAKAISASNFPGIEQCGDVCRGDYTQYRGYDLLIGGSPCTYWSIARNGRETNCEGEGYKLFMQYVRALHESGCGWFLYENNYSIHRNIKEAISAELGVQPIMINSALLSAQNRKRCYWTNIPNVTQPEDKGIVLKDVLENGAMYIREKAYTLRASAGTKSGQSNIIRNVTTNGRFGYQGAFEPVRVGTIESASETEHDSKQYRVYSPEGKATTLCGQGGGVGAKTGLYATPITTFDYHPHPACDLVITEQSMRSSYKDGVGTAQGYHVTLPSAKMLTLTAGHAYKEKVIVPYESNVKAKKIYEVRNGLIEILGKLYPIKLPDGSYMIRKLTVTECERLQTLPDSYTQHAGVSKTQCYKAIGNGWTIDVIAHILRNLR